MQTRGQTPKYLILRGCRNGRIIGPVVAPGGLTHPVRAVEQGGPK